MRATRGMLCLVMSVGLRSMFSLKGNQTKFNKTAFKNTSLFDIVVASVKEVCRGIGKPVSIDKIHTKIGAILKGSPNDRGGEHYKSKPHKSTVTPSTSSGMSTSAQTAPDSNSAGQWITGTNHLIQGMMMATVDARNTVRNQKSTKNTRRIKTL